MYSHIHRLQRLDRLAHHLHLPKVTPLDLRIYSHTLGFYWMFIVNRSYLSNRVDFCETKDTIGFFIWTRSCVTNICQNSRSIHQLPHVLRSRHYVSSTGDHRRHFQPSPLSFARADTSYDSATRLSQFVDLINQPVKFNLILVRLTSLVWLCLAQISWLGPVRVASLAKHATSSSWVVRSGLTGCPVWCGWLVWLLTNFIYFL